MTVWIVVASTGSATEFCWSLRDIPWSLSLRCAELAEVSKWPALTSESTGWTSVESDVQIIVVSVVLTNTVSMVTLICGLFDSTTNLASAESSGSETVERPLPNLTSASVTSPFSGLNMAANLPPSRKLSSTLESFPEKFLTQ